MNKYYFISFVLFHMSNTQLLPWPAFNWLELWKLLIELRFRRCLRVGSTDYRFQATENELILTVVKTGSISYRLYNKDCTDCLSSDKRLPTVSNLLFHPTSIIDISWICYFIVYWPRVLLGIHYNFVNFSWPINYEPYSMVNPVWSFQSIKMNDNLYPLTVYLPSLVFWAKFPSPLRPVEHICSKIFIQTSTIW